MIYRQLEDDIIKLDKKTLIQILHFLLTKMTDLKKRYYLSKYLTNIIVSDEYTGDEEIVDLMNKYKELQADFQATHQMAEELRNNCPVFIIFKIISLLKSLKTISKRWKLINFNLIIKYLYLNKDLVTKPDFMALFDVTSKLRKEQEEDSNLDKKLMKQQNEIEDLEERILISKQRLNDARRNLNENVSAYELLDNLRNQRNSNRENYEHLTKYEIPEKKQKLKLIEEIINQPEISRDDIAKYNMDKKNIQTDIEKLENKIKNSASKSSELSIYKQQAQNASNLKESALKILEKADNDRVMIYFII